VTDTVIIERPEPAIAILTLNRPERLNALSYELVVDLHDALDVIGGDTECKVAILTGAGRGFCSGLDLRDYGTPPRADEHPHANKAIGGQEFMANLTVHLRKTPQVIIGAINGPAFGGGLSVACATDIRLAAASAQFCSAFIRTGLTGTDIGITYLLPRLIGTSRAFDLIFTGREIDAAEAERLGLVSRVVPDDRLLDEALETAHQIARYTHTGLTLTKEVLWHNVDSNSMEAAIALENRNQQIAARTKEVQEYMAAYAQNVKKGR
jgi:enoyl-CoA hydratase